MEMGEGGDGPLSLLYFVESNIFGAHLSDGCPQYCGVAVELSWSSDVVDGSSRSLCLCI